MGILHRLIRHRPGGHDAPGALSATLLPAPATYGADPRRVRRKGIELPREAVTPALGGLSGCRQRAGQIISLAAGCGVPTGFDPSGVFPWRTIKALAGALDSVHNDPHATGP